MFKLNQSQVKYVIKIGNNFEILYFVYEIFTCLLSVFVIINLKSKGRSTFSKLRQVLEPITILPFFIVPFVIRHKLKQKRSTQVFHVFSLVSVLNFNSIKILKIAVNRPSFKIFFIPRLRLSKNR